MQEAAERAEDEPGASVQPEPGEHPAPGSVDESVEPMEGEAPTG